ncbi:MAG: zinc dependent phospholipase C family protein, partial [Planctomycetes bacterium]|nr:zinc dependent phospholipase C family protein [Planctomycetota bacterium]
MILAATIAAVILIAGLAWGPGFHASCADRILGSARDRRRRDRESACIADHPVEFVYGNIAADLINMKRYGGAENGCHDWSLERRMLPLVRSDAELAFALGCLTHLAADVVAHNFFVPFHRIHGFPPLSLGHAYWEARADGTVHAPMWDAIAELRRRKALRRYDRILHDAVPRRAFSLASNRFLF